MIELMVLNMYAICYLLTGEYKYNKAVVSVLFESSFRLDIRPSKMNIFRQTVVIVSSQYERDFA